MKRDDDLSKVVVVGSLNMDIVVRTPRLPLPGETITANDVRYVPGGKGANQAYAVGKLGGSVAMIGAVGNDEYGEQLIENLESVGVDTTGVVKKEDAITGNAFIQVDDSGENTIVVVPGANRCLTKEDIDQQIDLIENCEVVMMQLEIPLEVVEYVKFLAKSHGKKVVIDPAPAKDHLPEDFFSDVDVIKPNEIELAILLGHREAVKVSTPLEECKELIDSAKQLLEKDVKQILVTVGSHGVLNVSEENVKGFDSVPVKTVDSTAAGDSFLAAYVVGITNGKTESEAIDFARHTSALAVTKEGAQTSIPTADEVKAFREQKEKNGE